MKHFLALTFTLFATTAIAETCTGTDLKVIPEMEAAKDAFFEGDYVSFAAQMGPNFPGFAARAPELFRPLAQLMEGAYASCVTILQRHETPGFYQDLTIYYDDQLDGPITLLLIGGDFDGEFRFLEFTFDTSISKVLNGLR